MLKHLFHFITHKGFKVASKILIAVLETQTVGPVDTVVDFAKVTNLLPKDVANRDVSTLAEAVHTGACFMDAVHRLIK